MNTEERLEYLARQLVEIAEREKQIKAEKEEAREAFFNLVARKSDSHSPVEAIRTIEVPLSYFETTGQTKEEFVASRFPGWITEHVERTITKPTVVFVLKRDPAYQTGSIEVDGVRVSKVVSEYTPEVDWETLEKEDPMLFKKLAAPQIEYVLNEDALEKMMYETPEDLAVLQRHMKARKPSLKITTRKVKDEGS